MECALEIDYEAFNVANIIIAEFDGAVGKALERDVLQHRWYLNLKLMALALADPNLEKYIKKEMQKKIISYPVTMKAEISMEVP